LADLGCGPRRSTAAPSALTCTGKGARAAGETEERLYSLAAWRESPLYTEGERAAPTLCEAMTPITDGHVAR
jgi:alkylhydroperoxidase family enzyme